MEWDVVTVILYPYLYLYLFLQISLLKLIFITIGVTKDRYNFMRDYNRIIYSDRGSMGDMIL